MSLTPITPQPVNWQVYKTLERALVECALEPNAVLKDRELATQLGVSRTPVRDALHLLESTGLVERRSRTGWVVTGLEARDVEELFELRCLLEPSGLARIAEWDDEQLKGLTSSFDEFSVPLSPDAIARYLQRDGEFHRAVVGATENRRIVHVYDVVERQVDRCRHFISYRYEGRVDKSLEEHRGICHALASRDAATAAELLIAHIRSAMETHIALIREAPSLRGGRKEAV